MAKDVRLKINVYNWNSVLNDVLPKLEEKHELVDKYQDADVVVLWNEIKRAGFLDVVLGAQKKGIPVILYQQGVWGIDRVEPPFNEKIQSDVVLVWGQGDKDRLIKYGVPAEKIIITGSPVIQKLKPREEHEGKNVVFALEHWDWGDVPENHIVAAELRKLEGANLITKGLDRENETDNFDNPIKSCRVDDNHLDVVANLLARTDLVVAISESTFAFLAEVLDIPVILPDVWIQKPRAGEMAHLDFEKRHSDAVTIVPLKKLNKTIYKQLKHPEILREERKKNVALNGGIHIKDPVQNIIKCIESFSKQKIKEN